MTTSSGTQTSPGARTSPGTQTSTGARTPAGTRTRSTNPSTQHVSAPDGRRITFDVSGPSDGPVVLFCAAAPGSRRYDPDPAATEAAGVRLVTIDRPGYGESDPMPVGAPYSVADAADDAALVLDTLEVTEAGLAGWSAGGRVALALAARRPELVRAVAVIGTPAPDEEVGWIPDEYRAMIVELRKDPATATSALTEALSPLPPPEQAVASLSGGSADDALLDADPAVMDALVAMLAEAYRQGAVGTAGDIVSYTLRPWGFDPRAVGAPVHLVYGEQDAIVSVEHATWWASQLPDATTTVVPDVGHLVVRAAWADILDQLR